MVQPGDRIQNALGHWYDVLETRAQGFQLRVQPLTPATVEGKETLIPLGPPLWAGRSDFKYLTD